MRQTYSGTAAGLPTLPGSTPGPGRDPSLSASGHPLSARRTPSSRWNAPAPPCFAPGSAARSIFDGRLMASSPKGTWISPIPGCCRPPGRPGRKPSRRVSSPYCCQVRGYFPTLPGASSLAWQASCWASSPAPAGDRRVRRLGPGRAAPAAACDGGPVRARMRNRQRSDGSTPADLGPYR